MNTQRFIAWAVLLAWTGFWGYFAVAGGIAAGPLLPALARIAVFILVFGSALLAAARWTPSAGYYLIALTVVLGALVFPLPNPPMTTVFLLLTLALPPAVAGGILLGTTRGGFSHAGETV